MADITIRWAGSADAVAGSMYKVERTLDNVNWTVLAAGQAATAPYVSDSTTLSQNASHGQATLDLTDTTAFAASGYAWMDDALVQWTGKTGNQLTGVMWHSGYGTYAVGTAIYEAHESYVDVGVTISLNAVVYRITHTDASGNVSAPAYLWYYSPPLPASGDHCVVILAVASDLGLTMQESVTITCQLTSDDQFSWRSGQHLDANANPTVANTQVTNVFGLAFFHCWKTSARENGAAGYEFVLKPGAGELKVTAGVIPDRDWVLLGQILS